METFIIIGRNAVLVMIGITIFSGFFVAFTNFLVKNTAEEYPESARH